jgi:hypothetical protein
LSKCKNPEVVAGESVSMCTRHSGEYSAQPRGNDVPQHGPGTPGLLPQSASYLNAMASTKQHYSRRVSTHINSLYLNNAVAGKDEPNRGLG